MIRLWKYVWREEPVSQLLVQAKFSFSHVFCALQTLLKRVIVFLILREG